ncbi:hypothetical protein GCM10009765_56270 [Fodinicola feengrottensis]|uniref:Phosphoribosyltransferase n=1 Tax=Fodinicola feengrottensis TaxID=435914 RepID=A0ABN2I6L7_9ACTN
MGDRLGVRLRSTAGIPLDRLLGLAVRRNPKRAHLLVSTVLGKHVPTDPRHVHGAGLLLGRQVAVELAGRPAVVIGNAETATALGHCVAEAAGTPYLHSTRRPIAGVRPYGGFAEAHSHATDHLLLPTSAPVLAALADPDTVVVLADDELSTGATALGTIAELHRLAPHRAYLLASLVDMRSPASLALADTTAAELGVSIGAVSLAAGTVELPADILTAGQKLVAELDDQPPSVVAPRTTAERIAVRWPSGVAVGARHGVDAAGTAALAAACADVSTTITARLTGAESVLVLGFEELMYAPLLIASALTADFSVRYSTTTRSPVLAVDDPGYAIRTRLSFPAHDDPADGPGPRFAYNVADSGADAIVLVVDEPADTPALPDLLSHLCSVASKVLLVVVPA